MIDVKLAQLLSAQQSLQKLLQKELNIKTAYKLHKLMKSIQIEYENFNNARNNLIKKYGEQKEDDFVITDKDQIKKYQDEIEELLSVEIKLDHDKINLDDIKQIELSALDINNLEFLINAQHQN